MARGLAWADPGQPWMGKADMSFCVPPGTGWGGLQSCLLPTGDLNLGTILI